MAADPGETFRPAKICAAPDPGRKPLTYSEHIAHARMFSRGLAKRSGSLNPNEDLDAQSQRKLFILRNFRKGGGLEEKFQDETIAGVEMNPLASENSLGGKSCRETSV